MILDSKLPGRVLPEHPIGVRLWLSGAIDLGEMLWLAVQVGRWFRVSGLGLGPPVLVLYSVSSPTCTAFRIPYATLPSGGGDIHGIMRTASMEFRPWNSLATIAGPTLPMPRRAMRGFRANSKHIRQSLPGMLAVPFRQTYFKPLRWPLVALQRVECTGVPRS